jgi:hypothetical protein
MVCAADVPRSRLVKYPLLLKQVVKYSDDTDDIRLLQAAITSLEKVSLSFLSLYLIKNFFVGIRAVDLDSLNLFFRSGYGYTDPDTAFQMNPRIWNQSGSRV